MSRITELEGQIAREMCTCVHFNGVFVNESCKAGVNFHEQFGTETGCFKSIPCTQLKADKSCPKCEYPSREVAEKTVAAENDFMERFVLASNMAHMHAEENGLGVGNGGRGEMPCPTGCGGTLRYTVAGVNGHMHAKCSSIECVSWME